tara:strand:+ start:62097 stop:63506 length:1410 start_codon:yes stop_codon:yes gene_type:complete
METSKKILFKKYNLLLDNKTIVNNSSARTRIKKLKKLKKIILKNRVKIKEALKKDFKKNPSEVDLTEIFPIVSEINFTVNNLRKWMKDEYVRTPLTLLGSKSFIRYEAKGVVLIITPWNFPINLSFISLINALSAGNSILIKPSEITSETSYVIKNIIEETFDEKEVSVVLGGVDLAKEILKLKFNHILFIGSPTIGREVMKSASVHLSSVTLELGGKSPTVVDKNCDIKKAAKRVVWAKLINNGQVCIAPDYVLIHEDIKNKFVKYVINSIKKLYGDNINNSQSYCRIVNNNHFKRLKNLIDDSLNKNSKILYGGNTDSNENYIEPTLIENIDKDSKIFNEEIFGPILPIFTFKKIDEAITFINKKNKPLALYIFSSDNKNINKVLEETSSGGVCINHNTLHYSNYNLPFGGIGNSGFGRCHGEFGFKELSNKKSIFKQFLPFSPTDILMPPYNSFKQKIINLIIKYF